MIERAELLPEPRGELSAWLIDALRGTVRTLEDAPFSDEDPIEGEDTPLALYLCYELHFRGWPGVDERWEWEPSLLHVRRILEHDLEARLRELVGAIEPIEDIARFLSELTHDADPDPDTSIAVWMLEHGELWHSREEAVHRSAYQLKEADPHTLLIPRLSGRPKAALIQIQKEEYGEGREEDIHAELFATTLERLGLDPRYHAYLDHIPGLTLTSVNLTSMFSLHRRLRGAAVGHLAAFEMTSVRVMADLSLVLRRHGLDTWTRLFYDTHVVADAHHQTVAAEQLAAGLADQDPQLVGDIAFGALALGAVESRLTRHVTDAWDRGDTSLRRPLREPSHIPGLGEPARPADDPRENAA